MEREKPLTKEELINRLMQINELISTGIDDEELFEQRDDVYTLLEDKIDREDRKNLKKVREELSNVSNL